MSIKVYSVKKQKITYAYKKIKDFEARITNNVSCVSFSGEQSNGNLARQLMSLANLNANVKELSSCALKNCTNLTAIDLSSANSLSSVGDECFSGCTNIAELHLPLSLKNIGKSCFSGCRNLTSLDFYGYDCHVDSFQAPQLEYASDSMLDGTSKLEQVVFPQSLASQQSFNASCLKNASAKRIVFLGLTSAPWLTNSNCLGLKNDCELYSTSKKNATSAGDAKYLYLASSNTLTKDTSYTIYQGAASQAAAGRIRLRKPNIFTESTVKWCVDPSVRTSSDRIQSSDVCPVIVIYLDVLTSSKSYKFFSNVLKDSSFIKLLKQKLNCYVFVLFRNGDIGCTNSDLVYFKNVLNAGKPFARDFVSVNFYYGDKFSTFTTDMTNTSDFVDLLAQYADVTGFSTFNYEEFEIKLEEPYEEEIPNGSSSAENGYNPWWFSNGTVTTVADWNA